MSSFWRREKTIGDVIAESLANEPEQWAFGSGFPLPLKNRAHGWTISLSETWAGDSLDCNIPLNGREVRRVWGGVGLLREHIKRGEREAAMRNYAASGIDTRQSQDGETRLGPKDESPTAEKRGRPNPIGDIPQDV